MTNEIVKTESQEVMSLVAEAARSKDIDVGKMEKLIDLQERILDRNAKQAFAADFVRMKPHLKRIENKHNNTQTKSKYAKLEDINKEIDPVLEQFGFSSMTPVRRQEGDTVTVAAILLHKEGHQEETELTLPLDKTGIQGTVNKTSTHAIASSIKYCRRIALCAILNISTGDGDDKDGNVETGNITTEQAAEIDLRLRAISDKALPNFLKWGKVENLTDIPVKQYNGALKALTDMEQTAKKAKDQAHV